jgi:hypothetical protein
LSEAIEELNLEFLLNELEKWTPGQVEVVETRRRVWKEDGNSWVIFIVLRYSLISLLKSSL